MITKERLQELIELGATIYYHKLTNGDYFDILDLSHSWVASNINDLELDRLFETKEEVDWDLEFGNITRTETLSLPNYKVAKTYIDTDKFILEDNSNFKFLLLSNPDNIIIVDKQQGNQTFNKPLTKDNYIEACRLAKKLFLSEEE